MIRKINQYSSTLQAMKSHQYCDIFYDIGNCDLTSHVDFYQLSEFAKKAGFKTHPTISQKEFLTSYGIDYRLQILYRNKDEMTKKILHNQYDRLKGERQMGLLFRVLELSNSS